jgi:hypothetical protein
MSVKYAPEEYIAKLNQYEAQNQSNIKTKPLVPSMDEFNRVWSPNDITSLTNPGIQDIANFNKLYEATYSFGAQEFAPAPNRGQSVNIGCKAPSEYSTATPVQMTRLDGYTHTFDSCRTNAILKEYPYFAVTKPVDSPQNKDEYNCYVSKDISNSITNYYDYVTVWSLAPQIKSFGLSPGGDIIIDAENIQSLGTKLNIQNVSFSTKDETYTLGDVNTFVNTSPQSFNVYAFNITQVNVLGATIYDTVDGNPSELRSDRAARFGNTNNQFILAVNDIAKKRIKMVGVEVSIVNKILHANVFGAKQVWTKNPVKTVQMIASNQWLQIAELAVYDENNNDISKLATVDATLPWPDGRVLPGNANEGVNSDKSHPLAYHSGFIPGWPGIPFYRLTFPTPVFISKIVYYNRRDCCAERSRSYTLTARDADNKTVFETSAFTGRPVDIFNIDIQNNSINMADSDGINKLWNLGTSAVQVPIVNSLEGRGGLGLRGLNVFVSKDGFKTDESAFIVSKDKVAERHGSQYASYAEIAEDECRAKCVNNLDCKTYSISNKRTLTKVKEGPPKEVGGFGDRPDRALEVWYLNESPRGRNDFTREECAAKTAQKHPNNKYIALQYGGHCFSSSKDPNRGYAKYGTVTNCGSTSGGYCNRNINPIEEKGGGWSNHVFERTTVVESSRDVVTCNLYGSNEVMTIDSPGAITGTRNTVTRPVNTTGLNLTNNILKYDMPLCNDASCKLYIELGNDGNIKLYKTTATNTSSSNGTEYWNLFKYDDSAQKNINSLQIIPNSEWQAASKLPQSNNILSPGEFIYNKTPTETRRTSLISTNGKFKLELINGTLQLKTTIYGCFSSDPSYKDEKSPIYTQEIQNKPNSYYVYNSKLDGLKMDQPYYMVKGHQNKVGIRPIAKDSPLLVNTNQYGYIPGFKPTTADADMTNISKGDRAQCEAACNANPKCNYAYLGGPKTSIYGGEQYCYLGNKPSPAYIGNPNGDFSKMDDPKFENYGLLKKMKKINIDPDDVPSNSSTDIRLMGFRNMQTIQEGIDLPPGIGYGTQVSTLGEMGRYATPSGQSLLKKFRKVRNAENELKDPNFRKAAPPADEDPEAGGLPKLQTFQAPPPVENQPATLGGRAINQASTISTSNIISGIKSATREGFDDHSYTGINVNCGKDGYLPCETSILYGQILPLQKIANDYSKSTAAIDNQHRDLSNNIINYKALYSQVNADKKYDFNTSYPIETNAKPDLHTVRHNDSTQIALQSNNMYIAGSMLTTAILISAIYLGRS